MYHNGFRHFLWVVLTEIWCLLKKFWWSVLKTGRYKKLTVRLSENGFNGFCMAMERWLTLRFSKSNKNQQVETLGVQSGGFFTWPGTWFCFQDHNAYFVPQKMSERQTRAKCEHVLKMVTQDTFFRLRSPIYHKNNPKWPHKA